MNSPRPLDSPVAPYPILPLLVPPLPLVQAGGQLGLGVQPQPLAPLQPQQQVVQQLIQQLVALQSTQPGIPSPILVRPVQQVNGFPSSTFRVITSKFPGGSYYNPEEKRVLNEITTAFQNAFQEQPPEYLIVPEDGAPPKKLPTVSKDPKRYPIAMTELNNHRALTAIIRKICETQKDIDEKSKSRFLPQIGKIEEHPFNLFCESLKERIQKVAGMNVTSAIVVLNQIMRFLNEAKNIFNSEDFIGNGIALAIYDLYFEFNRLMEESRAIYFNQPMAVQLETVKTSLMHILNDIEEYDETLTKYPGITESQLSNTFIVFNNDEMSILEWLKRTKETVETLDPDSMDSLGKISYFLRILLEGFQDFHNNKLETTKHNLLKKSVKELEKDFMKDPNFSALYYNVTMIYAPALFRALQLLIDFREHSAPLVIAAHQSSQQEKVDGQGQKWHVDYSRKRKHSGSDDKESSGAEQAHKKARKDEPIHIHRLQDEAFRYGFLCHNVRGNGNCFYYAVADQLERLGLGSHTNETLRQMVYEEMLSNPAQYALPMREEFMKYLERIRTTDVWADNPEVQALVNALNVNIFMIQSDGGEPICINSQRQNPRATLYLGYEINFHYQSLIRMQK